MLVLLRCCRLDLISGSVSFSNTQCENGQSVLLEGSHYVKVFYDILGADQIPPQQKLLISITDYHTLQLYKILPWSYSAQLYYYSCFIRLTVCLLLFVSQNLPRPQQH